MALRITKDDGAGTIAIPLASSAEVRALDCYDAIVRGAFKTRIADAQVVTAKKVVSFPLKSGQFAEEINRCKTMAREELKGQNIDTNDSPAAVKKSFDAMPVACGLRLRKNDRLV